MIFSKQLFTGFSAVLLMTTLFPKNIHMVLWFYEFFKKYHIILTLLNTSAHVRLSIFDSCGVVCMRVESFPITSGQKSGYTGKLPVYPPTHRQIHSPPLLKMFWRRNGHSLLRDHFGIINQSFCTVEWSCSTRRTQAGASRYEEKVHDSLKTVIGKFFRKVTQVLQQ